MKTIPRTGTQTLEAAVEKLFDQLMLVAALGLVLVGQVSAQTFTTLYNLAGDINGTNSDGSTPQGLTLSSNMLYGTCAWDGTSGWGTVFKLNTDGTKFTILHPFTAVDVNGVNSDGAIPNGGLVLSGNTLYGTTGGGGSSGNGTIFTLNTDGTGFTTLYSFSGSDGYFPNHLILAGSKLYGTARGGGNSGGTVFGLNTDGTGFTTLNTFTNSGPVGNFATALVLSGDFFYGTTDTGGSSGNGTVFKFNSDGTRFAILHSFTPSLCLSCPNNDGVAPGDLIQSGNTLYGTTVGGGSSGNGTIFTLNTDGTGFTTLHSFSALSSGTNSDGADYPTDRAFYATVLSGNRLYNTAPSGGSGGNGTIFSITLPVTPPQLTISPAVGNVILSWPTNAAGFTLQSTTNLVSAVWTANLPPPVLVNGLNTVTNPISGRQQFYRLAK